MGSAHWLRSVLAVLSVVVALAAGPPAHAQSPPTVLLFSFFRDNGQDGLFLAWSRDGLKWEEFKPPGTSFIQPVLGDKLMRDPCLQRGPDGTFHMVWTTSWRNRLIARNPVKKNLRIATGSSPEGPWSPAGPPFTRDWVEGPSAIRMGGAYYVYFDHYAKPQYYGAVKSLDLKTWNDISKQIQFPAGARHGTVLHVPEALVQKLQKPAPPP